MTAIEQNKLGKTLWSIADDLRGAKNTDDFVLLSAKIKANQKHNFKECR